MTNKTTPRPVTETLSLHELAAIHATAEKIARGTPQQDDLASMLFEHVCRHAGKLAGAENKIALAAKMMLDARKDHFRHRETKKETAFANSDRLTIDRLGLLAEDASAENADGAELPPGLFTNPWPRFFNRLDAREDKRARNRWRKRFRRRVDALPPRLYSFVQALRESRSRKELARKTGLSRKGCWLRQQELKEIFADLLAENKKLRAHAF